MIECVFTIDYEIYGNGEGALKDLVYEPAERLMAIFRERMISLVVFVEAAEIEMIEAGGTDPYINLVKKQIQEFYEKGFEIGLHLHPQWYNACHENGKWLLDFKEYNLCNLPRQRIFQIVDRSIKYLQNLLGEADFSPFSFRAGNWLFQPTQILANVIADRGIKIDSSVFKGGLQYQHKLDYRGALKNGYYWSFTDNVNIPFPAGLLLELPIHTQMVWPWQMYTTKRMGLQQKASSMERSRRSSLYRLINLARFRHPLKFDFCRMTIDELIRMINKVIEQDQCDPESYRPIVAIGHTKDLFDYETIESFLSYLQHKEITVSTLKSIYPKCSIGNASEKLINMWEECHECDTN